MVDIHSHILPGIDDGAKNIQESFVMLKNAFNAGVEVIVATPHLVGRISDADVQKRDELINEMQTVADKNAIEIQIKPGYECYISPEMNDLGEKLFEFTINKNGKYILLELPMQSIPYFADETLVRIKKQGITPIIAHPERNIAIMNNPKILQGFIEKGYLAQLNAGSILGYYGNSVKNVAKTFLRHNYINVVASDIHSTSLSILPKAFSIISELIGLNKASIMFNEIPYKIVMGEDFDREELIPYIPKKQSFIKRILKI
ncbi:MAG: tyrosine-protein phosphatase [Candidatus Poribacteria bacterium]